VPADDGDGEGFFGERAASVYDERVADMCAPEVVRPVVELLAGLAGAGAALEFAIGTGVPDLQRLPLGQTIVPFRADPEGISFDVYDVVTQRFSSRRCVFAEGGVQTYPVEFRYAWPAELELMARIAGLTLQDRWAGWRREAFTSLSRSHVSVYERR